MADITASVYSWSTTEASNSPSGSTTIGTGLDDNLRAIQSGVATWVTQAPTPTNVSLTFSVGASALTIALKTKAGTDPSSSDKAVIPFRNVTAATGDYTTLQASAATSLVISSTSTLGTANSTAFRLWVVAFNDGGTLRLGVINCLSGTNIYPLSGWGIASSTAEGGAGGADSAQVFYTGTEVTSKAYTVLGYATWETGLATAGTWSAAPTRAQLFHPGNPLPGQATQSLITSTGAVATGTTTLPFDDTIPQNTEGDEYMTRAITPTSAANVLEIDSQAQLSNSAAGFNMALALFQDAVANALAVSHQSVASTTQVCTRTLVHRMLAATSSATTFKARAGASEAGTTTFNGQSGARLYGGVYNSYLRVLEIMA